MGSPLDVDAEITRRHLVVRLPASQILSLILVAGGLLGGVWIATDRLSTKVDLLGGHLGKLGEVLDRVQLAQHEQEARMRVIESVVRERDRRNNYAKEND